MVPRRATIEDVAREAGVSIKTVSRVFNREPNVRQSTQERVMAAAEALQYRPNLSARQLASKRSFLVGLVYDEPDPENTNDYVTTVQSGALQACQDAGYHLLISPLRAHSFDLNRELVGLSRQVDGFVLLEPISDRRSLNELLLENGFPCVRVSQRPFGGLPWISVADADAADEMTEYLLQLGHRRIAFIIGHPEHGQSHDRLAGYRRALERYGIEPSETLIAQGQFTYESGLSCARELLSCSPPPTAIFASNDSMAMGALSMAHEMGFSVPNQVSIAGFDDAPMARHAWPPLTTVRQPIAEVARLATEELIQRLEGRSEGEFRRCLRAQLVPRASTARPAPLPASLQG